MAECHIQTLGGVTYLLWHRRNKLIGLLRPCFECIQLFLSCKHFSMDCIGGMLLSAARGRPTLDCRHHHKKNVHGLLLFFNMHINAYLEQFVKEAKHSF